MRAVTVIGIDLGTTSCKAGAFSLDGKLLGHGAVRCSVSRSNVGWVEQDATEYWSCAAAAIRQTLVNVDAGTVVALGCCGHTPSLVLIDQAGQPVRPVIIWQDSRATTEADELDNEITTEQWRDLLGMDLPRNASYPPARLRWLRKHEPEIASRVHRALQPKDFVNYHLTGIMASDFWSSKALVHLHTGEPIAAYRDLLGIDPGIAPPCHYPHEPLGTLSPSAAQRLGLPAGIPVAIGWSDAMAGMLGTGALADAGLAFDIAGTSEIVGLTAKGEPPYSDGLLIAPVLDTDLHIIYGPTQTSGGALQWFVDAFCSEEERNSLPALLLEADRATEDMIFLPYLEGERAPIWNPHVRGAFHRISSTHTKGHFLRAVLEGVAFSIRHVLDIAQKAIGASSSGLLLSMGGAALPAWNQIKADVLGIQVQPTAVPDAGTLGAAMLAALAAQEFEDIRSVSRAMVRLADPVDPRPDAHCHYDELYRDYLRMSDFVRRLDHVGASSVELPRHMT